MLSNTVFYALFWATASTVFAWLLRLHYSLIVLLFLMSSPN